MLILKPVVYPRIYEQHNKSPARKIRHLRKFNSVFPILLVIHYLLSSTKYKMLLAIDHASRSSYVCNLPQHGQQMSHQRVKQNSSDNTMAKNRFSSMQIAYFNTI